jgi:hypothetical protein
MIPPSSTSSTSITERAGRWLAARTTRRSFIGNVGKVGLVAVGGSLMSQVMSERAEARVCGQSGVSPKCPTYDCFAPSTWGWCWYAGNASCCADGGLKKICDCCRSGHPNVHGYCPEGSNVYCVVESCLEDPRVMKVVVASHNASTAALLSVQRTSSLANGSSPTIVIAHPTDRLAAALATPVAALFGAATLTTAVDSISPEVVAEIARLGSVRIIVTGYGFEAGVIAGLGALPGVTSLEHIGANPSVAGASIEVARWLIAQGAKPRATVCGAGAGSLLAAPAIGSYAALSGGFLLVGTDAAVAFRAELPETSMTFVGEAAAAAKTSDGSISGVDPIELSRKLADDRLAAEPTGVLSLSMVPAEEDAKACSLTQAGSLTIVHAPDGVDVATRDWLLAHRTRFTGVHVSAGGRAGLAEQRVYEVQSAVNGFNAHLLTGSDGMGLPVIPQPNEERPFGKLRVTGPAPTTTKPMSKRTRPTTTVKLTNKPGAPATTRVASTTSPSTTAPPTTTLSTTVP